MGLGYMIEKSQRTNNNFLKIEINPQTFKTVDECKSCLAYHNNMNPAYYYFWFFSLTIMQSTVGKSNVHAMMYLLNSYFIHLWI